MKVGEGRGALSSGLCNPVFHTAVRLKSFPASETSLAPKHTSCESHDLNPLSEPIWDPREERVRKKVSAGPERHGAYKGQQWLERGRRQ